MRLLAEERSYIQVKKETEKSQFELSDPNLFIGMYRDCLVPGTEITRPDGTITEIENLLEGDIVLDKDGNSQEITKIVEKESKTLIGIKIQGGWNVECTPTHNWPVVRKGNTFEKIQASDLEIGNCLVIPRTFKLSKLDDISNKISARLLGYYVAEGSKATFNKDGYGIAWAYNINELDTWAKDTVYLCKELGCDTKVYFGKSVCKVRSHKKSNAWLADWLFDNGGEWSHAKKLSEMVMGWPLELKKEFIKGYFRGDGSYSALHKKHQDSEIITSTCRWVRATTVSKQLANQIQLILAQIGIFSKVKKYQHPCNDGSNRRLNYFIDSGSHFGDQLAALVWGDDAVPERKIKDYRANSNVIVTNNHLLIPIIEISKKEYNGIVYGITVSGDHSYLVNNVGTYNSIYKNKLRVVPQEYMANARDAHREAGINDPIEVTLPTVLDPILTIRDFGIGIDEERKEIFRHYGKSTKRGNDVCNGGFGIGCKCAWSYTEQFTVDTVYIKDGKKINRVYSLYITNKLDPGNIRVVSECEVDSDTPTGTKIQIPIMESDVYDVCRSVATVGAFWDIQPIITNDSEFVFSKPTERRSGTKWCMQSNHHLFGIDSKSFAVVDGICYKLDLDLLARGRAQYEDTADGEDVEEKRYNISKDHKKILNGNSMALFFDVNEVEVAPDRENLDYNVTTIAALRDRIQIAAQEFIDGIKQEVLKEDADYYSMIESLHSMNIDVKLEWNDIDITEAAKCVADAKCHLAVRNSDGEVRIKKQQRFSFKNTDRDKTAFLCYSTNSGASNAANRLFEAPEAFDLLGKNVAILFYSDHYGTSISRFVRPFITHDKVKTVLKKSQRPRLTGLYDKHGRGIVDHSKIAPNALFVTKKYRECCLYHFGGHPSGKSAKVVSLSDLSALFPNNTLYSVTITAERALKKIGFKMTFIDKFVPAAVEQAIRKSPELRCYEISIDYAIKKLLRYKDVLIKSYGNKRTAILAINILSKLSGKSLSSHHRFLDQMATYFDIKYFRISDERVEKCCDLIKKNSPYYEIIGSVKSRVAKNIILSYKEHHDDQDDQDDRQDKQVN